MKKVDDIIEKAPAWQVSILQELRAILLQAGPAIQEQVKYGIPFYHYYKPLCYFTIKTNKLIVGFVQGILMNGEGMLQGDQKQVRHFVIHKETKVDFFAFRSMVQEAILINEELIKKK